MKAIIILNYASEEDIGKKTSIRLKNEENKWIEEVEIKPMPEPIYVEVNKIEDIMHTEYSIEDISAKIRLDTDKIFSLGWNACLEEITGE